MNYPNVKRCDQCSSLFAPTWQDQLTCTCCQPLTVDPAKLEIIRSLPKKAWGGVRPSLIK